MVTRMWRGWTRSEDADAYEQFLLGKLFPSLRSIGGFAGADVLRHAEGEEVGFVTLVRFESLDDVKAFAGESYETPVLEPEALALLSRHDDRAVHYETSRFA